MWIDPSVDLDQVSARPLYTFILKTASNCNLACSYCYVYFSVDQSWRQRPPFMADEIVQQTARRIAEHVSHHSLEEVQVVFHGGEPLLTRAPRIVEIIDHFNEVIPARIVFGVQTNGTLLTPSAVRALASRNVRIGVSIDGDPSMNRNRLFRNGRPSFDAAMRGIETVRAVSPQLWTGLLVVVDLNNDPGALYAFLRRLQPPVVDIVLPDRHHVAPPRRPSDDAPRDAYGRWMARLFDDWFDSQETFRIRYFDQILSLLLGGSTELETIGGGAVDLIVVEADGQIEPVDTLKVVGRHATDIGLNVIEHSFDDAVIHPAVRSRMGGPATLCADCRACAEVRVCGGGYLPHRYGPDGTFNHPSVYCHDILYLIRHIRQRVRPLLLAARTTAHAQ